MELKKIREMSEAELNSELVRMKKDLFNLRFQHVTGQLENPIKMRETKRDIARVKTIIREKDNERILVQFIFFQRFQNPSHTPIQFLYHYLYKFPYLACRSFYPLPE